MSISMGTPQSHPTFQFPPGVRFHPSDEELIVHYLLNKVNSRPLPAAVVGEIELYNHNPWELPKKAPFGEEEWYFFSPRERKYPNGARPNRTAASGYWKATGTDKAITSSSGARIGVKKALVFYVGKPPSGIKTDWIMTEYRIPDTMIRPQKYKGSMRLDDWVLCRLRQKGNMPKNMWDNPPSPNKPLGDIPNMNDLPPPPSTDPPPEACTNYFLSKDCQLLAKLLAAQGLPPQVPSASRATSHGSNAGQPCNATYDHRSTMENQVSNAYFQGAFTRQEKHTNENGYGNFSQAMPMMDKPEILASVGMPVPNNTTFYTRQEAQDLFNLNLSSSMCNLQGLDVSRFAKRFHQ